MTRDRALALVLLIPAAALVYGGAFHWYVTLRWERAERIETLHEQLAHYEQQAARVEALRTRLESLRERRRDNPYLMDAAVAQRAAAALKRRLDRAVAQTRPAERACRVDQANSRSSGGDFSGDQADLASFERVQLQVQMDCGVHGLVDVLPELEGKLPFLSIENFQLRRANPRRMSGDPEPVRLQVSFLLTGHILSGSGESGSASTMTSGPGS